MAMILFNKGRKKEKEIKEKEIRQKEIKEQEIRMRDILRTIVGQEVKEAVGEKQALLSSDYSELSERLQRRTAG